jgi:hypothetical protein
MLVLPGIRRDARCVSDRFADCEFRWLRLVWGWMWPMDGKVSSEPPQRPVPASEHLCWN